MILTEQAVDDLTSMSCSDIGGRRLRLATQNGLIDDLVPSSEKAVGESEGVSVTVDLLKTLASPSSKFKGNLCCLLRYTVGCGDLCSKSASVSSI
jgi:hypothetical protein